MVSKNKNVYLTRNRAHDIFTFVVRYKKCERYHGKIQDNMTTFFEIISKKTIENIN